MPQASVVPTVVYERCKTHTHTRAQTQKRESLSLIGAHAEARVKALQHTGRADGGKTGHRARALTGPVSVQSGASEVPWTLTRVVRIGWGREAGDELAQGKLGRESQPRG